MKPQAVRVDDWVLVTPSDTGSLPRGVPAAILVTVAGDVEMKSVNGNTVTVTLPVGSAPYCPAQILAAGTTATVYALY